MKAEQAWAQKLTEMGCTLPRGKAFKAQQKPALVEAKKVTVATVDEPKVAPKPVKLALSEAQQNAMTELGNGAWIAATALSARKTTLNALIKKGLLESQEQEGVVEYRAL